MKLIRRINCILLAVLLLLAVIYLPLPAHADWEDTEDAESGLKTPEGLRLMLSVSGTYWVTGIDTEVFKGGKLVVPAEYLGNPIVAIEYQAFYGIETLTHVELPDTITKINGAAFEGCTALEEIYLPDSVTIISQELFKDCTSLKEVRLPEKVQSLNLNSFEGCTALEKIVMPKRIADFTGAELPVTVLDKMVLPSDCEYVIQDGCMISANTLLLAEEGYRLPENDRGYLVGAGAYANYKADDTLVLPKEIKSLEANAFLGTSFEEVVLNEGLQSIRSKAFAYSDALEKIRIPGSVAIIEDGAFFNCFALKDVHIEEGVKRINQYAFCQCKALEEISLPDSVEDVGRMAFYFSSKLEQVHFGKGLKSIGEEAFSRTALKEAVLPEGVENIWKQAFAHCADLERAVIPKSVFTLENAAFAGCTTLKTLQVEEGNEHYEMVDGCLIEKESGTLLAATIDAVIPNDGTIKAIADRTFWGYGGKEVRIPDGITALSTMLFYDSAHLERVYLPASLETIGTHVFDGCSNLQEIVVDEDHPYYRTYKGNLVSRKDNVLVCGGSNARILPESGIVAIGRYAYAGRTCLTDAYMGSSVKSIENCAFIGCTGLKTVRFAEGIERIGGYVFDGAGLRYLILPESLKVLEEGTLFECKVEWIYIPKGLKSASEDSVYAETIYYGGTKEQWRAVGYYAYYDTIYYEATPPKAGDETTVWAALSLSCLVGAGAVGWLYTRKKRAI